ncbi:hypothetical protein ACFTWF_03750 [Rhodococcus sp. NPDC056960]|uniref:hypothetical protein n=1 Tax=Rhodococcus sp. NPDC056960 TaxID=3345982 RepID=UPI0036341D16
MTRSTSVASPQIQRLSAPTVRKTARRNLTESELRDLRRIAASLIPGVPGRIAADQVATFDDLVHEALAIMDPHFDSIVAAIDRMSDVEDADMFAALRALDAESPTLFYPLSLLVAGVYLYSPEVEAVLQYPHPHRNPAGAMEAADEIESGILDPVIERGPIYVAAPTE